MGSEVQIFPGPLWQADQAGQSENLIVERSAKHDRARPLVPKASDASSGQIKQSKCARMIVLHREKSKETKNKRHVWDNDRQSLPVIDDGDLEVVRVLD